MLVVLLRLSAVQSGGDFVELTFSQLFTLLCRGFFLVFTAFFKGLSTLPLFWLMVAGLACYAVVCLVWSLILDD